MDDKYAILKLGKDSGIVLLTKEDDKNGMTKLFADPTKFRKHDITGLRSV